MLRPTLERGATGLCAFVLVLSAVGASVAHAEAGAHWKLNGANVTSVLLPSVAVKEVEGKKLTLVSELSGIKVEMICTGASLEKVKLQTEGSVSSEGKVRLSGCLINLNNIKQVACEPHVGAEKGVILTNESKALLVLEGSRWIVRIEPKTGETLATVETGPECLAGEKIPVIGKLTVRNLELEKEAATHLLGEPSGELWLVSKTEEHKATVSGSAVLELSGEHKEKPWSAAEVNTGANWKVKEAKVTTMLLPEVQISEVEALTETKEKHLLLSWKIATVKVEILCTGVELENSTGAAAPKLLLEGTILGRLKSTGCILKSGGTELKSCKPHSKGSAEGTMRTELVKGSIKLHIGEPFVQLEPDTGTVFMVPVFGQEGVENECSLGEKMSIGGSFSLKDEKLKSESVEHLFAEGPLSELWIIGPEHRMTLNGSVIVHLVGEHLAKLWSGMPG